jgi:glyoxylase-like metal-dependent hydrolase (beta-lactamase superfamily II)
MKVSILRAGYCTCPEHLAIRGGRWRGIRFPAMFALLEHERFGPMLFDTGYSQRFFDETRNWRSRPYRWLTPVTLREDELAANQLAQRGLRASDIQTVFISHFHADHISALSDFSAAQFVYLPSAYARVRGIRGLRATTQAFLPGLIPHDFEERSRPLAPSKWRSLPKEYAPFEGGYDILGDESLVAVELPGHATGQMGLIARAEDRTYFFVADAAWLRQAVEENRPPHRIANMIFSDPEAYGETLAKLHAYHKMHDEIHIVPSHCEETLDQFGQ